MEMQQIIDLGLGAVMAVIGWFARELWSAVKELKSDLSKLREDLPKDYVARDDYRQDIRELKEIMNKIFDRLDNKQDKWLPNVPKFVLLFALTLAPASAEKKYECVRWRWYGDFYERKVYCIEWREKKWLTR